MPDNVETAIGPVTVSFDAGENGPTHDQVAHWQSVIADFSRYRTQAQPLLLARMREFGHESQLHELTPAGLGFYDDPSVDVDWDVSFDLPAKSMLYTVSFKDGQPTLVHADS